MAEAISRPRLEISSGGEGHAILDLPVSRLEEVRRLLDAHSIDYWTDEWIMFVDDEEGEAMIVFSYKADVAAVQGLLDSM